jgi:hypothetical protein
VSVSPVLLEFSLIVKRKVVACVCILREVALFLEEENLVRVEYFHSEYLFLS